MKSKHLLGLPASLALSMVLTAMLSACSGGSNTTESGTLELAITDAEEDFLSYQIELDSVTLNRRDGTRVDILPLSTDIDFVQYQDLSELFAVMSVPAGVYESITLSLDYSEANIVIQNESGESAAAVVVDRNGAAVQELDVELLFDRDTPVVITPRRTSQLTLDLDLAASNTIESFDPAIVTVEPFMLATAEFDEEREHRVRGLLDGIDLEDEIATLRVRPMRLRSGNFGEFDFAVDMDTVYEINGTEYSHEEGLAALAALDVDAPVVTYGVNRKEDGLPYLASHVMAGTSVPWNNQDVLKGVVTARSGNTLTIDGAVIEEAATAAHFRQSVSLTVADTSTVTGYRLGDAEIENLSVGQRVLALGAYDASSDNFDASQGLVRMKLNRVVGEVVQSSPLLIDVNHINRRPVDIFDFSGSGTDEANDADPENYEIDTGALDLSGVEVNEWLQIRGYPTAFGAAPLDFDALSIVNPDFEASPAKLHIHWSMPSDLAVTVNGAQLSLDTEGAREKLHLVGVPASSKLGLSVSTMAGTNEPGLYALLIQDGGIHLYRQFDDFALELGAMLDSGLGAKHLTAAGQYTDASSGLLTDRVTLVLAPIEQSNGPDQN